MGDDINGLAVSYGRCANFALRIRRCVTERPVQFAGIHRSGNPFIAPRAKYDRTIDLREACGRPTGALLPPQLSRLLFKGINITAIRPAAAVSGNEKCSLVEQRIAMEAARATIHTCIV